MVNDMGRRRLGLSYAPEPVSMVRHLVVVHLVCIDSQVVGYCTTRKIASVT